ncbi:MAG TPA: restriction endonuclease-like protein [Dongiaceae bacterium]|nr:restriction endonuclease-like protein [Dongiaceae bacterium]
MPEVLRIENNVWTLSVWTKDAETPRKRLAATLDARERQMPVAAVRLSPPVPITTSEYAGQKPSAELVLPKPVFFENRLYEFDFQFPAGTAALKPEIIHWRTNVQDAFHLSGNSLRGSINFGNDIGWFRLGLEFNGGVKQFLSFEVLPTKMDMAGDFDIINTDIDTVYPLWRFSFARKTEQELTTSRKPHEHFPLLWLALFKSLRVELENSVKLICRSPHARLLPQERFLRPDRLKGRLSPRLEEQVTEQCTNAELHRRHRVETRRLSVDTPENRFVKMVLTRCTRNLTNFITRARKSDSSPEQGRLSRAFYDELAGWKKPLEQRLAEPLFREVGDYSGMAQESLVLHHKAGYAKTYRIWHELKLYLDLFGRQASVSMKSVAELYEVWCLLEIRRMLLTLGFSEDEARKAALRTKNFEKELADGMGTAFHLRREGDDLKIRLAHEPCFSRRNNNSIYSFTTSQKPDIMLEATFSDGRRIHWIFDAKYRISPEDNEYDHIPDDAINQMHRYRDALIHLEKADDGVTEKSRPVVGAFVLYPGYFNSKGGANPYQAAIETVGIGGFPLLPGQKNHWLKEFLAEKFGDLSEGAQPCKVPDADEHLLHESVRIAPTGLSLERYDDLTLVASLGNVSKRDKQYVECFMTGTAGWYHIPASTTDKKISRTVMRELRFCAVAVHTVGTAERRIEYLYEVESVRLVKRNRLTAEQAGSVNPDNQNEYWLLHLGAARLLPAAFSDGGIRKFRFRLTGASDLLKAKNWNDLSERYASFVEKSNTGI